MLSGLSVWVVRRGVLDNEFRKQCSRHNTGSQVFNVFLTQAGTNSGHSPNHGTTATVFPKTTFSRIANFHWSGSILRSRDFCFRNLNSQCLSPCQLLVGNVIPFWGDRINHTIQISKCIANAVSHDVMGNPSQL